MSKVLVVDCLPIDGPFDTVSDEDFKKVAEELGTAMCSLGICYLVNHGVDPKKIEQILRVSQEFFELPRETKNKYRKLSPKKLLHGYAGPGDEVLDEEAKNSTELREVFDILRDCWHDDSLLPIKEIPDFKAAFNDAKFVLDNFGKKLLRCLEIYFKFEKGFLIDRHKNVLDDSVQSHSVARTMYYYLLNPNDNIPPNAIRCGEHKDWGSVTLLFQDMVGGLEVETLGGEWIEAVPIKDSILFNVGQLMEFYTSGQLRAAKHRVRIITKGVQDRTKPRQSFIYFFHPDGRETVSSCLPILPGNEKYATKKPVNANDHVLKLMDKAFTY